MKMRCNNFQSKSVKDLLQMLSERKVIFSEKKKKSHRDECVRTVLNLILKKPLTRAEILNKNHCCLMGHFFIILIHSQSQVIYL